MTKTKIFSTSLALVTILLSLSLFLLGCGEKYPVTYGTYVYSGMRLTNVETEENVDQTIDEITSFLRLPVNVTFNEDGTALIQDDDGDYSYTWNYKVSSKGFVTFSGDNADIFDVPGYSNNGYFEGNKFYLRFAFNTNTNEEMYSVSTLSETGTDATA